jgi:ElaB/YqjD/DUF883 family membrane-anchored ribosome-binding protein
MNKLILKTCVIVLITRPWSVSAATSTIVPVPARAAASLPAADDCKSFVSDLKQMKQAQESIQQSLISNHDMMADSLETYADALTETSGKAYKKISENMAKAGESIRKRKTKAQEISKEFSEKASEMLKTAEKCIKR